MKIYLVNQGTNPPIIFDNKPAADYYVDTHNKRYPNNHRAYVEIYHVHKDIIGPGDPVDNPDDYIDIRDI